LKAGVELIWRGVICRIVEVIDDKIILARDDRSDQRASSINDINNEISLGLVEFRSGSIEGSVEQVVPFSETVIGQSNAVTGRLLLLTDWLRELDGIGLHKINPKNPDHHNKIETLASDRELGLVKCSIWTLYRAQQKVIGARGKLNALLPKYHLRGRSTTEVIKEETGEIVRVSTPRMNPVVATCLVEAIATQENNSEAKLKPKAVAEELKRRLQRENLNLPVREQLTMPAAITIARWVKKTIPAFELSKRHHGTVATKKAYRVNRTREAAERILQFVQFDDVDARVFLIDEDTGQPWGTANFTFGVDEKSQCLMGVTGGPEPRNVDSAISTVIHAMRRKNMADPMLQTCTRGWMQCGQFGLGIFDNASYNHASTFKLAMIDLDVDFAYSKPKEPTNKSKVEGFNRTFKYQFAIDLPGACVKKNDRDNLNPALRSAKLTLDEFMKEAMRWIVDEYSHERGEDGRSPLERWNEQVDGLDLRPPLMARPEFCQFILPETLRFRDSGGLERKNLRYQCDRLDQIRRENGSRTPIPIRVNPQNIETIFVADTRSREWFTVPCVENSEYIKNLTEQQHQLTLKFAREAKKQGALTSKQLALTRDDLRLEAIKGEKSRLLSVRGTAFLIKHAFRSLPRLNRSEMAESALQASRMIKREEQEGSDNRLSDNNKSKPSRRSCMEDAFAAATHTKNL
jgi:hypothetical protein